MYFGVTLLCIAEVSCELYLARTFARAKALAPGGRRGKCALGQRILANSNFKKVALGSFEVLVALEISLAKHATQ